MEGDPPQLPRPPRDATQRLLRLVYNRMGIALYVLWALTVVVAVVVRPKSWTERLTKYDVSKRRVRPCASVVNSAPSSRRASCSKSSVGRNGHPRCVASTNSSPICSAAGRPTS